jgi:hypothetical protein
MLTRFWGSFPPKIRATLNGEWLPQTMRRVGCRSRHRIPRTGRHFAAGQHSGLEPAPENPRQQNDSSQNLTEP